MALKVAIVGLPNVGKSTLFNALTKTAAAQAANYPFCTIEPNTGDVAVPEARLNALAEIAGSKEIIPARITFVDVAGLDSAEGVPVRERLARLGFAVRRGESFPGLGRSWLRVAVRPPATTDALLRALGALRSG